jgi:hypothetical protein
MTVLELDLTDKANPPPDDAVKAPHGWMWDRPRKTWRPRKSVARGGWGAHRVKTDTPNVNIDMGQFERDVSGDDPAPSYASRSAPKIRKTPPKVSAATKNDIAASCGMVGMLVLPPIVARDPFCGGALTENFQAITDALVPLLCRSATVVGFFTDTAGDFMLWFKLAMALAPVGVAVGQHHVLKTVEIQQDEETGEVFAVKRDLSGYTTTPEPEADTIVTAPAA